MSQLGRLGLDLHDLNVAAPSDLEPAFRNARRQGTDALYIWPSGFAFAFGKQIADLAIEHRMPSLHPFREGVFFGSLLAYAADLKQSSARAADYVDRILRGTPPNQLPVEQLSKYELLINLKTAKALGLELPATLLAQADEVIE